MNYVVDIYFLSKGREFENTMIYATFVLQVDCLLLAIANKSKGILTAYVQSIITKNIIIFVVFGLGIFIIVIPLSVMLKKMKKKHEAIFDLIASVEVEMVMDEVVKLEQIIMIVNNSTKSSELLKSNTINYLARKRISSEGDGSEMVEGLDKENHYQKEGDTYVNAINQDKCKRNNSILETKKLKFFNLNSK
eukprot:GHVR01142346.1.p1 GENE.GHVR01142346.1~~GHVR01142346.1.p1  ORF type:complete len:192 (-),score=4.65 GHVR01142346.1:1144-1719(-)